MADHRHHFGSNTIDFSDDDDDFSDDLSPSDGYFSHSSHVPQNVLVLDEPEDNSRAKEREAHEESSVYPYHSVSSPTQASSNLTRNTIYTPSSSSQENSPTEEQHDRVLHLQNDPPPLYEAATAPPSDTAPLSPQRAVSYNTMNTVGFPVPFRDSSDQPQSMADRPDDGDMYGDEETVVPLRRKRPGGLFSRATTGGRFRRFVLTMLAVLAGFMLISSLIGEMQEKSRKEGHHDGDRRPVLPNHPVVSTVPSKTLPIRSSATTSATSTSFPLPNSPVPHPLPNHPTPTPCPKNPSPTRPRHEIRIVNTSNPVRGVFRLRDLLYIRTTSGSVSITVVISEDWNDDYDIPSILDIATQSGSITVRFVDDHDRPLDSSDFSLRRMLAAQSGTSSTKIRPFRQYISSSGSGGISGYFLHGNSTILGTRSGSISGKWYPISLAFEESTFKSIVHGSGSTSLSIEEPLHKCDAFSSSDSSSQSKPLFSNFFSMHESYGSGSIGTTYPPSWTGSLEIQSRGSGSVTATGDGLQLTELIGKHLKGYRGYGAGSVRIFTQGSGSISFRALGSGRGGWLGWLVGENH